MEHFIINHPYKVTPPSKSGNGRWHIQFDEPENSSWLKNLQDHMAGREVVLVSVSDGQPKGCRGVIETLTYHRGPSNLNGGFSVELILMEIAAQPVKSSPDLHDPVNHPKHYNAHPSGIECIDVVKHMGFCLGNVIKYVWRADHKNGVEDLEKARWYLDCEIAKRKAGQEKDND